MRELEVTWRHVLSVGWLITWRGFLGAFSIAVVITNLFGVAGVLNTPGQEPVYVRVVGATASGVWGLFVLRMALEHRYRAFRIVFVRPG
jgi:hypothetical protein